MTKRNETTYTTESPSILKRVVIGAVGTIASYYAAQWAKKLLEEKPLKTRVREGKAKMVDIKNLAMSKAKDLTSTAKETLDSSTDKLNALYQDKKEEVMDKADAVEKDITK